jgi:spoIIIJ-associated protein
MEWVETTGPTVEDALDAALDELGVDEDEVEFEILQEAKAGLFGRIGGNPARIRARVKPVSREKPGDRNRGRGSRSGRRNGGKDGGGGRERGGSPPAPVAPAATGVAEPVAEGGPGTAAPVGSDSGNGELPGTAAKRRRRRSRGRGGSGGGQRPQQEDGGVSTTTEDVPIGEQAAVADEFMRGLVAAFGLPAEVSVRIDEDAVLVDVEGEDLGLLVGPKGATLRAVEDLVRTVVQRRTDGHGARIHVDVGGYQAKRRAALANFARELAARVVSERQELALEPMPPADRKVVHDTVAEIEGVTTISEGEEPRRRVVLRPE